MFVVGRRGSGKSTLLEDIMCNTQERYVDGFTMGMSPTRASVEMMEQHMPSAMVFNDGFSAEHFQKLLALGALIARKKKLRAHLLTLDDCNADKDAFRSKSMRDAFMNGRHYGLNILWSQHYCMDILPALRTQVDYVFVLKDNSRRNKQKLYENFFSMFPSLDDFIKVMDNCTQDNECLVLDNTVPDPDPQKCLYWYKAKKQQPPFKLGSNIFYKLDVYYKREQEEDANDDLLQVKIRPGYHMPPVTSNILPSKKGSEHIESITKQDK